MNSVLFLSGLFALFAMFNHWSQKDTAPTKKLFGIPAYKLDIEMAEKVLCDALSVQFPEQYDWKDKIYLELLEDISTTAKKVEKTKVVDPAVAVIKDLAAKNQIDLNDAKMYLHQIKLQLDEV